MSWGTTISPNWENIIILSQEFPHYRKIFHVGLAQGCTFASALLPLTLLYTSVGSRGCLQLFTCDGFSTPALSSPHVALCSAQLFLSPFFLLYFPFPLIFTPCLPSFHASNLSSSLAPHHHHHHHQPSPTHPSLYISPNFEVPVSTWAWQVKGVSLLLFSPPPSCSSKSCSAIYLPHHTISSHVRETCRHPSATFDHCFYWDPSLPCSALGWQRRQSVKEWKG